MQHPSKGKKKLKQLGAECMLVHPTSSSDGILSILFQTYESEADTAFTAVQYYLTIYIYI